jgi:hypothetical protein
MFVLFIAGEPMTGQRMFQSDEEEGADWQVSSLAGLVLLHFVWFWWGHITTSVYYNILDLQVLLSVHRKLSMHQLHLEHYSSSFCLSLRFVPCTTC